MRLIDADKLKRNLNGNIAPYWVYPSVTKMIDEQPTIDAVPVSHGHWKIGRGAYRLGGEFVIDEYNCSNCSESSEYATKYCPHCGARTDGEDGDSDGK